METEIREEVSNEMANRLSEMESIFTKRLYEEIQTVEEKYEKKMAILNRMYQENHSHEKVEEEASRKQMLNNNREKEQLLRELKEEKEKETMLEARVNQMGNKNRSLEEVNPYLYPFPIYYKISLSILYSLD